MVIVAEFTVVAEGGERMVSAPVSNSPGIGMELLWKPGTRGDGGGDVEPGVVPEPLLLLLLQPTARASPNPRRRQTRIALIVLLPSARAGCGRDRLG
jgi:hypothetical protein